MRKISFKLLTQASLEKIEANVTTFGDLKRAITNSSIARKINFNEVKFIEKNTKAEFGSIDEAILPAGDLLFYVTPVKTKSGLNITPENFLQFSQEEVINFMDSLGYNEIRTFGSKLNSLNPSAKISLTGTRADICENVCDFILEEFENMPDIETLKDNLTEAIELITVVKEALDKGVIGSFDELQAEAERLSKLLNK